MEQDQTEQLIKEIAAKHGIAVGRDDPILILQTINEKLMQDSQKAQQDMLREYKEELEELTLRWGNDAKEKAEKILNAALGASKEAMTQLMHEGAKEIALSTQQQIEKTLSEKILAAKKVGNLNILSACITLIAACIVAWALLK